LGASAASAAADCQAHPRAAVGGRANVAAAVAVLQADVSVGLTAIGADANAALAIGGAAACAAGARLTYHPAGLTWDSGASSIGAGGRATVGVAAAASPYVHALLRGAGAI